MCQSNLHEHIHMTNNEPPHSPHITGTDQTAYTHTLSYQMGKSFTVIAGGVYGIVWFVSKHLNAVNVSFNEHSYTSVTSGSEVLSSLWTVCILKNFYIIRVKSAQWRETHDLNNIIKSVQ